MREEGKVGESEGEVYRRREKGREESMKEGGDARMRGWKRDNRRKR